MTAPISSNVTPSLKDLIGRALGEATPADVTAQGVEQAPPFGMQLTGGGAEPVKPRPITPIKGISEGLRQVVLDPVGTIVGVVKGTAEDIALVSSVIPEELADERIQANLQEMGFTPERLETIAQLNRREISVGERAALEQAGAVGVKEAIQAKGKARTRLIALGAGLAAGGVTAVALRPLALAPAAAGSLDALAFGTVVGGLNPVEEGQTRAGNVITSAAIAVPLGTLGGMVSQRIASTLRRKGVRPEIEAPEIAPPRKHPIDQLQAEVGLGGRFTEGAAEAAARRAEPGRLAQPVRGGSVEATIAGFEGRATARARQAAVLPEGAPAILGGTAAQLVARESKARKQAEKQLKDIRKQIVKAEEAGLTPESKAILGKISVGREAAKRPFSWNEFYTKNLDDLHPINVATKELLALTDKVAARQAPGVRLPGIQDPYVLARLTRGSVGKANAFLETGPLDFQTLQPVGPGFREIIQPVAAINRLDLLRSYLASRRTIELNARGITTPFNSRQAATTVQQVESASPTVVRAAQQIDAYQADLLRYLGDSGLLSGEQIKLMQEANQSYVPFYRFIENVKDPYPLFFGPKIQSKAFANLRTGIRRIKGGEVLPVVDPLESIIRNTYSFVQLADRQATSSALVTMAERAQRVTGEFPEHIIKRTRPQLRPIEMSGAELKRARAGLEEVLTETGFNAATASGFAEDAMTIFRPSERLSEGMIWITRGGKRQFYEVEPSLYRSLLAQDIERVPQMIGLLAYPARTLRAGATLSPAFIARNPFRDQFTAAVFSRYGFKPGVDLMRGVFHIAKSDRLYQQFQRSGGEHAVLVRSTSAERAALQKTLDQLLQSNGVLAQAYRTAKGPAGLIEGLRQISSTMEAASRSQEFVRALAATADPRLAGFASREVTLDFARMGTQIRVMNQMIPFFNAQIQALDKAARVFKENPMGATGKAVGWISIPSLVLYAINHDDPNYQELSPARKDFFFNFPMWRFNEAEGRLEKSGEFFSPPKPFEMGQAFGVPVERALAWIKDNDPNAFEGFLQNTFASVAPNVLPTAIQVPLEALTNFSFFQMRDIVPRSEKDLLPQFQAGPRQGETVRLFGKVFGVSPRIAENTVRGFTASLGMIALSAGDTFLRTVAGVERPTKPPQSTQSPILRTLLQAVDVPVPPGTETVDALLTRALSVFITPEPTVSSASVSRFYRTWEQISAAETSYRQLVSEGRIEEVDALLKDYETEFKAYAIFTVGPDANTRSPVEQMSETRRLMEQSRGDEAMSLGLGRYYRSLAAHTMSLYRDLIENEEQPRPPPASSLQDSVLPVLGPSRVVPSPVRQPARK